MGVVLFYRLWFVLYRRNLTVLKVASFKVILAITAHNKCLGFEKGVPINLIKGRVSLDEIQQSSEKLKSRRLWEQFFGCQWTSSSSQKKNSNFCLPVEKLWNTLTSYIAWETSQNEAITLVFNVGCLRNKRIQNQPEFESENLKAERFLRGMPIEKFCKLSRLIHRSRLICNLSFHENVLNFFYFIKRHCKTNCRLFWKLTDSSAFLLKPILDDTGKELKKKLKTWSTKNWNFTAILVSFCSYSCSLPSMESTYVLEHV